MLCSHDLKFLVMFEEGAPTFHFAPGPTNFKTGPKSQTNWFEILTLSLTGYEDFSKSLTFWASSVSSNIK